MPFRISRESIIQEVVLGNRLAHLEIFRFSPHTVQIPKQLLDGLKSYVKCQK